MGLHHHRWVWWGRGAGEYEGWCQDCGLRKPPEAPRPHDTRYRIEYVDTAALIAMLQAAHDYAAENEHRADYWTCMAAYLAAQGLTYRYDPPKGTLFDIDAKESGDVQPRG